MNFDDLMRKGIDQGNIDWIIETSLEDQEPDSFTPPPEETEKYITRADMREFVDTFAELMEQVIDICTMLSKGSIDMNKN